MDDFPKIIYLLKLVSSDKKTFQVIINQVKEP